MVIWLVRLPHNAVHLNHTCKMGKINAMLQTQDPVELGFDTNRLSRIDDMMKHYIVQGKSAGMVCLVSRFGKPVYFSNFGYQNIQNQVSIMNDTIFRIYSMTKPITSVALMMLLEKNNISLDSPAHKWIPALKNLQVSNDKRTYEALKTPITIRHLLTHTAGFTYGQNKTDSSKNNHYSRLLSPTGEKRTLEQFVEQQLDMPLIAQPGELWRYSIATDICGYLVQLISSLSFEEYLHKNIFTPLKMVDTDFTVPQHKINRFATLYGATDDNPFSIVETSDKSPYIAESNVYPVVEQSGGGGLVSTAEDYWRFASMMLNRGELFGERLLSKKSIDLITTNQLPDDLLPISYNGIVSKTSSSYGFGLGYCINIEPRTAETLGSLGDYGWGGIADTYCWIDPDKQLIAILMQQFLPSLTHQSRLDFRNTVYQSLKD